MIVVGYARTFGGGGGGGFSDDFNRADETLATSADYTDLNAGLSVVSNQMRLNDPSVDSVGQVTIDAAAAQIADSTTTYDLTFGSSGTYLDLFSYYPRYTDASNWIRVLINDQGEIQITKNVAGSETSLTNTDRNADMNSAGVANAIEVVCSGADIDVTINSGTTVSVSETDNQSATGKSMLIAANGGSTQITRVDNLNIS